jgi:spore coat polysaccharide biosynthesis protein SpsF (cytidylyltransferase family)
MTTAVIVQARWASSRLPGKVLLDLAGRTVLHHVLTRCAAIPGADVVVCATPDDQASRPVASEAQAAGATVFRGSETDVLSRYLGAARAVNATTVMRVTSDCPMIDPALCGDVLSLRSAQHSDYACNNMPPSFPHGLDCEAFTRAALERAALEATDAYDREHVTPWLRRSPAMKRVSLRHDVDLHAEARWTLDHPEDYAFFSAVFALLPPDSTDWRAAKAIIDRHPEIVALNAGRRSV